jgi:hypothetical protein
MPGVLVRQQAGPLIDLGQHDDQGPAVLLGVGQSRVTPDAGDGFEEDRFLPAGPPLAGRCWAETLRPDCPLEALVLGRVEDKQQRARLGQVPGHRCGGRILAGEKVFARVVVEAEEPREPGRVGRSRMLGPRTDIEKEWVGVGDRLIAQGDGLVKLALQFCFSNQLRQRHNLLTVRIEEKRLLALAKDPVRGRVDVHERGGEVRGEHAPKFVDHRRQQVRLPAGRGAEDREEVGFRVQGTARDAQVAIRASEGSTRHPPGVESIALNREAARKESLLLFGTEQRVSSQVGMFRHPKSLLGGEDSPAMGAGDPGQQTFGRHGGRHRATRCPLISSDHALREASRVGR